MSYLPKVTPGVEGGAVTADIYTAIQELSAIPWQDTPTSTKATSLQTEQKAVIPVVERPIVGSKIR
jgi:hypothetical protein